MAYPRDRLAFLLRFVEDTLHFRVLPEEEEESVLLEELEPDDEEPEDVEVEFEDDEPLSTTLTSSELVSATLSSSSSSSDDDDDDESLEVAEPPPCLFIHCINSTVKGFVLNPEWSHSIVVNLAFPSPNSSNFFCVL